MGRMDGNFRLRLPKTLPSFLLNCCLSFPCNFFNLFPQTSSLGYLLDSFCLKLSVPFSYLYFSLLELFLCHFSGKVYCSIFLGFLTLLANFGLVAPIPVGISVLGVETPLRT